MNPIEDLTRNFFKPIPHIIAISLFGSQAQNRATNESDVDVAIFCEIAHIPTSMQLIEWREELSHTLGKDVDLVCLNGASPILGMQVFNHGKVLSIFNSKAYDKYKIALFFDYEELKELRAPMEKDILKRKYYD